MALLLATDRVLLRVLRARRRAEAAWQRTDTREWVVQRRERTRHLIELGGLVQKAGLVDLCDDDRAMIYGALMELAQVARSDDGPNAQAIWKRRGKRKFEAEEAVAVPGRDR